jgi:hypothetical protein
MVVIFHGDWLLRTQTTPGTPARIRISGSDHSDAVFPGNVDEVIGQVSGASWAITMEWFDDLATPPAWREQAVLRLPSFTLQQGLVVNLIGRRSQTVVICTSMDPAVLPRVNPYTFTIPADAITQSGAQ